MTRVLRDGVKDAPPQDERCASLHVGWAERFLRSPTNTVGLPKKLSAQPTRNSAQHQLLLKK